jgi:pyruvate/2-oxoglutarate dehydrogenase complex dihydrolipoamide dehydrogenase (E3) component
MDRIHRDPEATVTDKPDFDILIIGSGEAGKYLAWTMAKAGRRTAVVERGLIGGSCPNIACLPSKNIIHSAKVAAEGRWHRGAIECRPA